ncbi:hypothetical protein WMY93_000282 [Mugilogobius chulae]|uniref:Insulin-like domain-containing protein n=1 Tax=Mugilogobius chulae TaxID=88201 RepID=A0AAW0QDV1_9GOBI
MSGVKRVLLLLVLVEVMVVEEAHGQENIKMCGRDLIRHAVSYCGNSRLRRAVVTLEGPQQTGVSSASSIPGQHPPSVLPPQPGQEDDMEALVARWLPLSARMRRTALKISDLCCEKGCSKRELIQFC